MIAAALQQQQHQARRRPGVDPYRYWTAEEIAFVAQAPLDAVERNWPLLVASLHAQGINTRAVQAATIATVAIETAHTFEPVEEAFWLDDAWRYANLRYAPYWGRGFVQLTWEFNYRTYGDLLGYDLVGHPDLALEPHIAADVLALYFDRAGVAEAADAGDWYEVRRRVQGGYAAVLDLIGIVRELGA